MDVHSQFNLDHWIKQINNIDERCDLNGLLKQDKNNKIMLSQYLPGKEIKTSTLIIHDKIYNDLKNICSQHDLKLNTILQFIWHKVLSIYGNSNQTITGTSVYGIGLIPLIVNHHIDTLIIDAIKNIQDKINDMINRSDIDWSQFHLTNVENKYTLFDSLFIYQSQSNHVNKFDYPLVIITYENNENQSLSFTINYAAELFHDYVVDDLLDLTNHLLIQTANNHRTPIAHLTLLPIKQQKQIDQWNHTNKQLSVNEKQTTLHQLFEDQVQKSSHKLALVYEDIQLTYKQLNEKANQLAHHLQSVSNIYPDDLVALLLDKSDLMIVSILSVWKSGGGYVPIDPTYPDERIEFILQDTKAKVILTNTKYLSRLDAYDTIKIDIDTIYTTLNSTMNKNNLDSIASSDNLAYITYTSGTTGEPKGVMKEHKSVINMLITLTKKYNLNVNEHKPEKIALFSQYVFEPSIRQMLMALLNSHVLIIIKDDDIHNSNQFNLFINKNEISYLNGTASILEGYDYTNLKSLKRLIFAGEELTQNCFKKLRKTFKETIIIEYGPTEVAHATTMKIFKFNEKRTNRSIGKQIDNTSCYVLDQNLQQLPIGAIGELYIGGIGVARGYLNRPQLTNERFVSNPFQTQQQKQQGTNARIYKTGDLVRWLPNGEIEYLGRNDFQVKIRGLRIELGEIESTLSSYEGIKQSIVIVKDVKTIDKEEKSRKYLIGYYVCENDLSESSIKEYMQSKLPNYMIPNRLVRIEKLPITINGKLDRKALPEIDLSNDEKEYVEGRNEIEVKLCRLWSNLLGIESIGIRDDFFRLGGDSIGAVQTVGRLRQDYGLNISVKDIFAFKTIESLYDNKLKVQLTEFHNDENNFVSLLPMREYFHKYVNQYIEFEIAQFDVDKFKNCLSKLINRHEIFRISLTKSYEDFIDSQNINLIHINYLNRNEIKIDLENGPTYMVCYAYDHEDNASARIWFFTHQMIIDCTSTFIITEELQRLYTDNDSVIHSNNHSRYCHWLSAVKSCTNSMESNEKFYWQNMLNNNVKMFNDTLINKQQRDNQINEKEIILTDELNRYLFDHCNRIYNTQSEHLILTALGYTLHDEMSHLKENYILFEECGRNFSKNLNMNQSIGMFRTIYPLRLQLADNLEDICTSIINIKEHIKQVPKKGFGFAAMNDYESKNIPLISLNYLGQFNYRNNKNDQWCLLDVFYENQMDENTKELIKINALIINGQLKINVKTRIGAERTDQFAKIFQFNIEKVIKHTQLTKRSYLTLSDTNSIIKNKDHLDKIQFEKEIDGIFLANSLQQGLLYHSLKQNHLDDAYIVQSVYEYRTYLNKNLFKMAWKQAQKRFCCLRLRFDWQEELIQIIDREQILDWRFKDLTEDEENLQKQQLKIKQIEKEDRNERFKLDRGNLFRISLIQQNNYLFTFIFTFHHIILDGWSLTLLFNFVHQYYFELIQNNNQLLSFPSSFQDETYEKAQLYLQTHTHEHLDYWQNQLNKIEERCDLNSLLKQEFKNKILLNQYDFIKESKSKILLINQKLYQNLKQISRQHALTLNAILQFVWHKVLSIYGNSHQTITGTTVAGRNIPIDHMESSLGLFINTLPLVVHHNTNQFILDAIKDIQEKINEINTRSNIDLVQLTKQNMKHNLFDSLFIYENYPRSTYKNQQIERSLKFEKKYDIEKLDYPLTVVVHETIQNQSLSFTINYAAELFLDYVIDDLLDLTNHLLIQMANNHRIPIAHLTLLPIKQQKQIDQWNHTNKQLPVNEKQTTLHQLFEDQVQKSSDKLALVYEDVQLTYTQLNEKANQLAHYLQSISNIYPDDLVALLLDKSDLMIVSILSVWKSGGGYVPIDPTYPDERIEFILQDTKAKVILTNTKYLSRLDAYDIIKIDIDTIYTTLNSTMNKNNLDSIASGDNLAYVIYTSGTTGKPKGVMIEHKGVINLTLALTDLFALKSRSESILSFSNYVFDHFVEQMTYALLNSQVLVILNDEMRTDKARLYEYLNKNQVTYLSGTPSVLQEYDYRQLKYLIRIDAVGEDFSEIIFNKIRSKFNGLIINGYGPTEISITSHKKLYYFDEKRTNKSIGKQIDNTSCYVLDQNLQQLPIGAIGELYIGGIGVARGYLNRPQLTNERFLSNPFQTQQQKQQGTNARIYRTGDLVRWLPNGEIEYLGRNDFQVKIIGLRIELGEIESTLSSYDGIKQSIVIVKDVKTIDAEEKSRKYLIGYYVCENDLNESSIKEYMQSKLPNYMIPNRLVRIEKIPVNLSGKLDTRALPEVNFINSNRTEIVQPRDDLEVQIAQIWSNLLDIQIGNISVYDDFFSLGGDSILVIRLSLMLSNSLSVQLTVGTIFQNKTIAKLASYILYGLDQSIELDDRISKVNANDLTDRNYVLSFAQERLLFINEFHGENSGNAYNIPIYIQFLTNNIKRDLLYQSLRAILNRHEILRTLIREDQYGNLCQYLLNPTEANALFKIDEVHVNNKNELDAELIKSNEYIFNLREELPIKVRFYEMKNDDEYDSTTLYMGLLIHHICFDGWSWSIFSRDFQMFYDNFDKNINDSSSLPLQLPTLDFQYKDFAIWQRNYLTGKRLEDLLEFWKNKLNGFETLNLMTDCPIRPSNYDYSGQEIIFELNEQTTNALKQLAMKLNVTLFSLLLSAYTLMLSHFTNQQDIVIGTPVANRNQNQLENLIGFFVNILVLRIKIDANDCLADYITKVNQEIINAQIHQEMPFERIVKELQIENDPTQHPIVQMMFIMNKQFNNNDTRNEKSIQFLEYLPNQTYSKKAKYHISTSINETDKCLKGHFNFATKLFHENTINTFIQCFSQILTRFSQVDSTCKVADIDCLTDQQYNQIQIWNNIDQKSILHITQPTTLHQLFEDQVQKSSHKLALVYEDVQLSYTQLNEKANQLAHHLQSVSNIYPDDLIALLLDKSDLMIVSILSVWKSGGGYVPIDPTYPDERIEFILQDTKAKVIITNTKYLSRLDAYDIIKIDIDTIYTTLGNAMNKNNLDSIASGDNLAYVIYTSGTTGKPKGVLVEHKSVISLRNDLLSRYVDDNNNIDITPESVLFFSNYVFDFSIEQLLLSIFNSQTLIIPPNAITFDEKFYDYLNRNSVTYLSGTPTQLQQINFNKLKYLRTLTTAGEVLTEKFYEKIRKAYKGKIINAYGVTETTVYNMTYIYENEMKYKNSIGFPLTNTKRFVLNKNMQILPIYAIGELYLTGDCVSRGYLNRPELTDERFLSNPFQTQQQKQEGTNARIYKTGDLVRWLPNGEIEYLGRNDFQVKIRGLRIELGEIESTLSSYDGIKQSIVIVKDVKTIDKEEKSRKYLVGYYVSDNDLNESSIKEYMQSKLPNYMIPNRLVRIEKLPITINGKLDRKALPEIDLSNDEKEYVEGRNEIEVKLCRLWSNLLGIESIGIRDDFFRLGGDSISSLQLIGRIRKELSLSISVKDIFLYKTIESLYDNVLSKNCQEHIVNPYVSIFNDESLLSGEVPLLPIQEWFFLKHSKSVNHWNQAFLIETPSLDMNKLKDSLIKLIDHHDAFKLRFKQIDHDKYIQYYDNTSNITNDFTLNFLDIRNVESNRNQEQFLNETLTKWQSQFNIEYGPIFAVGYLFGYPDGKARIWFSIHHLIVDVVSWRILCEDLQHLYYGSLNLGRKSSSYKQWSQLIQSYGIHKSATERIYWHNLLNHVLNFNNTLSKHTMIFDDQSLTKSKTSITLNVKETSRLLRDCPHRYQTQINVLLLTALGYALKELTQNRINCVTLEGHGREDIHGETMDISRTVGWFTTMYPIVLEIADNLNDSIKNINQHLNDIPNKGIGYGTIIGYKDQPLPRVSFNYLGQFEAKLSTKSNCNHHGWYLTDGILGNEIGNDQENEIADSDLIAVNGYCMNGQIKFNIHSKSDSQKTQQFANSFKFKLEDIIRNCSTNESLNPTNDFEHPFVIFNENSEKTLFILPPGEGGAESYFNNLVPHLSSYKLVLFNNYYLDLKAKSLESNVSFERLASFYIHYIKQIQPIGPYQFLGWSFGGILSLEISRQLNNSGDEIGHIFMIDSYFNVIKGSSDIGKSDKINIIDRINYLYLPNIDNETFKSNIINQKINIVLFKANKVNQKSLSADQFKLFTYYTNTKFNNLDTLINPKYIQLFQMSDDTHFSWVFNQDQIVKLCNYLKSLLH